MRADRPNQRSRIAGAVRGAVMTAVLLVATGCSVLDRATQGPLGEVDPSLYELEITRCEVESEQDTLEALGEPLVGSGRSPHLVVEYTITNLDTERRRFDLRATSTDANDLTLGMNGHHSNRRDPQGSTEGTIRQRLADEQQGPFTCDVAVWDSVLDREFPDD